jgi:hypothetical protein
LHMIHKREDGDPAYDSAKNEHAGKDE